MQSKNILCKVFSYSLILFGTSVISCNIKNIPNSEWYNSTNNSPKINLLKSQLNKEIFEKELKNFKLIDGDTILDIGSNDGYMDQMLFKLFPNSFFVLEDVYDNRQLNPANTSVEFKKQSRFVTGTANKIPLATAQYKQIICRNSLHEFSDVNTMASEMCRVLQKSGILIISEQTPFVKKQICMSTKRYFLTNKEIEEIFVKNGLKLVKEENVFEDGLFNSIQIGILTFTK
jgi:SAM-dependent methyltransferase